MFIILILGITVVYYFVFNIYEVVYSVNPKELFADNESEIVLEAVPVNSLGMRVPFRSVSASFQLIEGRDLVDVVLTDNKKGKLILKAKKKTGIFACKK